MHRMILVFMALVGTAIAAPPSVQHQGRVLDALGVPVTGSQDIIVSLYDDAAATNPAVWTTTYTGVELVDGYFTVEIGSGNPLTPAVLAAPNLFIGVQVGTGAELTPRPRLVSTPYAIVAGTADVATSVSGGSVDATTLTAADTTVEDLTADSVATAALTVSGDSNVGNLDASSVDVTGGVSAASVAATGAVTAASLDLSGLAEVGALTVDGATVSAATIAQWQAAFNRDCPAGSSPAGAYCFGPKQAASHHYDALTTCMSSGKTLCSLDALISCDINNLNDANSDCNVPLDGSEIIWANELDPSTTVQWSVVASGNAATMVGTGNTIVYRPRESVYAFYCCTHR